MAYVRRQGRPAVLIDIDQATFAATMRVLKAADKNLYDEVRKTIRTEAAGVKKAQAAAVQGLNVRGASGQAASNRRAGFALLREMRASRKGVSDKRILKATAGLGLRAAAAKSLKVEYRERATSRRPFLGARIRMSASNMPPDQRRLPKHMNYGRWRHPVFGDRDGQWVTQTALPDGWFDGTWAKRKPGVQAAIKRAVNDAYQKAGLGRPFR